jgi:peptide/nickel transport system permease protein
VSRLLRRVLIELALVPLVAVLVHVLVHAIPEVRDDAKVSVSIVDDARAGVAAFVDPWQRLLGGQLVGRADPRTLPQLLDALSGSLMMGGLGLLFAVCLGFAWALGRTLLPPRLAALLDVPPVVILGTPGFVVGLIVVVVFGGATGEGAWVLGALLVALTPAVVLGSVLHGALAAERRQLYVTAAVARGRSRTGALVVEALPNALPAVLDAAAPVATSLLAGSVVVERLLHIQYFGSIYVFAASHNDRDLVVIATTVFAALLAFVSIAVHLLRLLVDPAARAALFAEAR